MTEATKSKLPRLAMLSLWLALVTVACFVLSFGVFSAWLHVYGASAYPTPESLAHGLLAGGLVLGYAWVIYRRLFLARTVRQRLLISIALGIVGALTAYYGFTLLVMLAVWFTGAQVT